MKVRDIPNKELFTYCMEFKGFMQYRPEFDNYEIRMMDWDRKEIWI